MEHLMISSSSMMYVAFLTFIDSCCRTLGALCQSQTAQCMTANGPFEP